MWKTRFYKIYIGIKTRCFDKKHHSYRLYGKRGIQCEWKTFEKFRDDMYESYKFHVEEFGEKNTQIDRIDSNKNYCKENCRWVTCKEQARNTNRNTYLNFQGKKKTVSEWAESLGWKTNVLHKRFYLGWSVEKALTTPISTKHQHFSC